MPFVSFLIRALFSLVANLESVYTKRMRYCGRVLKLVMVGFYNEWVSRSLLDRIMLEDVSSRNIVGDSDTMKRNLIWILKLVT